MVMRPWVAGVGPCIDIEKVLITVEKDFTKIVLNPDTAYNFELFLYSPKNQEIEFEMPFTKQHFTQTAAILKESKISEEDKQELFLAFSKAYGSLNPNFDSDRFYEAIFSSTSGVSQ